MNRGWQLDTQFQIVVMAHTGIPGIPGSPLSEIMESPSTIYTEPGGPGMPSNPGAPVWPRSPFSGGIAPGGMAPGRPGGLRQETHAESRRNYISY